MFIIFEGLDKTGKTTLEWEFLKATNFKYVVIDRGPVGYLTFDKLLKRDTPLGNDAFIKQARRCMKRDFIVVHCVADESVVNQRLAQHNEKQLECGKTYAEMHKLYRNNIKRFYNKDKVITVDTGLNTIDECVEMIKNKLRAGRIDEYKERKSGNGF